ncbi:MAG: anti-sigma F factor [Clostridiales bacterium]|jgi:stage II sporulation protein AB (anti-sigma F factor)|nr:anti-sigma F factor [Clostridiales bacterium]
MTENKMQLSFLAISQNESFARATAAAFAAQLNPTLVEITEIKTAVSEAVTNAIIHGYDGMDGDHMVDLKCHIVDKDIFIEISDSGKGIDDIDLAREPLYTSKPEMERSGMGFTVMEEFMDDMEVISKIGAGTTIKLRKTLRQ